MTDGDDTPSRPGSGPDLSRRMDRMERRQDTIETKVTDLAGIVGRVEINQKHAEELAVLRFTGLDTAVKAIDATLERFMGRINAIVSGEVKLPQAVAGEALVADYQNWRSDVDKRLAIIYTPEQRTIIEARLDEHDKFETQVKILGRLAVILVSTNVVSIVVAIGAAVAAFAK